MNTKQFPLIAREGWGRLGLIAVVGLVLHFGIEPIAGIPAWLFLLFTVYQFRDPSRSPPSLPLAVVSPIHGTVTHISAKTDPWLKRDAIAVRIVGGLLDIRSVYSPTEGKIVDQWRVNGSESHSAAVAYWIKTDEDDDVVVEIQPSGWHGPMSFRYHPGERVGQGRRVGFVHNGCIAQVYLPANTLVEVSERQNVVAAVDVLGKFVHLTNMASDNSQTSLTFRS
ncbi:MAG: phosphatidylserine decarboxylase [Gammaproteobacteria bacterium]